MEAKDRSKDAILLLKSVLESLKETIVLALDKDYKYLYFNEFHKKTMIHAYGTTVELGMNLLDCITNDEDRIKAKNNYDLSISGISHTTVEEYGDLNRYYYETRYNPVYNSENELIGTTAISTNITERKLSEIALEESELKYRSLIECSSDAIFCVDENGQYQFTNSLFANTFGKTPDYFIGKTFWDIYPKEHADMRYVVTKRVFETGNTETVEVEVPLPDRNMYFFATANPIKDDNGKVVLVLTHATDITELKNAHKKIREKDEEFRKLSANLPDLIFQFTRRADGSYFVPVASEGISNIFGCSPEDVVDDFTPIAKVLHPDDAERVIKDIEYSAENLSYFTCEFRVNIPGKPTQWIFSRSTPELLPDGSITWYGFNANITEIKQTELKLIEAKEKAEQSDRLKSAFLANMSHEIRTPMNGILGFADLLKQPGLSGDRQMEYISIIEKSGVRMLNIINDIIDISRIESGLMEINIKTSNVNEQMEDLLNFFKPEADKKHIELIWNQSLPSNLSQIFTDKDKLYAVLSNLVKNAIKHTSKGIIEFGCVVKKDVLEFYVKDTGEGISIDNQKLIFDRFRQVGDITSKFTEGAGLGLSISKAFVEMLGGRIWVESELGMGSTFYFTIPFNLYLDKTDEWNGLNNKYEFQIPDNLKILIADDDSISDLLVSNVLSRFCKDLLHAVNGKDAVEVCRNNPDLDIVLLDVRMPEINGYDATKLIRMFNKNVKIIAQTAFALSGEKEKAIEAGCNGYISKPINKEELIELIQKLLR